MTLIVQINKLKAGHANGTGWPPTHIRLSEDVYKALEAEMKPLMTFFSTTSHFPPQVSGLLIEEVPGTNIMEVYRK